MNPTPPTNLSVAPKQNEKLIIIATIIGTVVLLVLAGVLAFALSNNSKSSENKNASSNTQNTPEEVQKYLKSNIEVYNETTDRLKKVTSKLISPDAFSIALMNEGITILKEQEAKLVPTNNSELSKFDTTIHEEYAMAIHFFTFVKDYLNKNGGKIDSKSASAFLTELAKEIPDYTTKTTQLDNILKDERSRIISKYDLKNIPEIRLN